MQLQRCSAPIPQLWQLSAAPPASSAHFITAVAPPSLHPLFAGSSDTSFAFVDWHDELSFLVADASASNPKQKHVAALSLPLVEIQRSVANGMGNGGATAAAAGGAASGGGCVIDRWFDLHLPVEQPPPHILASNPLVAFTPEVKHAGSDVVLQLNSSSPSPSSAADASASPFSPHAISHKPSSSASSNPIGRIHLQLFYTTPPSASSLGAHPERPLPPGACLSFPELLYPLRMKILSWNAGNAPLPSDLSGLYDESREQPVDLFVIGLQECNFDGASLKDLSGAAVTDSGGVEASLAHSFSRLLPKEFQRVHIHSLWEMRLLIFIRSSVAHLLRTSASSPGAASSLSFDSVATGLGNVVANKGGILTGLTLGDMKLALVTGHLAAHTDRLQQRNKDLSMIVKSVGFPWAEEKEASGGGSASAAGGQSKASESSIVAYPDVYSSFHSVFVFGDCNYRLEWPLGCTDRSPTPQAFAHVVSLVRAGEWDRLFALDQLVSCRARGEALPSFRELCPAFAPSFKVLRNVLLGYTHKRLPSYTDRILWKSVFAAAETEEAKNKNEAASSTTAAAAAAAGAKHKSPVPPAVAVANGGSKLNNYSASPSVRSPSPPVSSAAAGALSFPSSSHLSSVAPRQLDFSLYPSLLSSDHKPVGSVFALPVFLLAGKHEFNRGGAELAVKKLEFSRGLFEVAAAAAAAASSPSSPTPPSTSAASVAFSSTTSALDDYTLELRAPFLPCAIRVPWPDRVRSMFSFPPFPLAYNNGKRIRRELVLVRLFKTRESGGGRGNPAVNAQPAAQGVAVLTPVAAAAPLPDAKSGLGTANAAAAAAAAAADPSHITEQFELRVVLSNKGILFGSLRASVQLRWKKLKQHQHAASASGLAATGPIAAHARKEFSGVKSPVANEDDEDDEEGEEEEDFIADTTPFSLPVLAQKSSSRSTLVALKPLAQQGAGSILHSASASSSSSSRSSCLLAAGGGLGLMKSKRHGSMDAAIEALGSTGASLTQRLKHETLLHNGGGGGASSTAAASSPLFRNLHLLIALLARSEEIYSHGLNSLVHLYFPPLASLVQGFEREFHLQQQKQQSPQQPQPFSEALWNARPSVWASDHFFHNVPLLNQVHATLFNEMEAQLRMGQFGLFASTATAAAPQAKAKKGATAAVEFPFPDEALLHLGELLQQFLPLFSLYRWTIYSMEHRSESDSSGSSTSASAPPSLAALKTRMVDSLRSKVAEIDRACGLDFFALLSLSLQRLGGIEMVCKEILGVLQRIASSAASKASQLPLLPKLLLLYSSLHASFGQLQLQCLQFQRWYPSLAEEKRNEEETDLYSRLAGEDAGGGRVSGGRAGGGGDSFEQRPSTNAALRPHSIYQPLATGFRPATAYGAGGGIGAAQHPDRSNLLSRSGSNSSSRSGRANSIPASELHLLSLKIQSQLKSRVPLAGFHPYVSPAALGGGGGGGGAQWKTQEDISLDFRSRSRCSGEGEEERGGAAEESDLGRSRGAARGPSRARAMSMGDLTLFDSFSQGGTSMPFVLSSAPISKRAGAASSSSSTRARGDAAAGWSVRNMSRGLRIGGAAASSSSHWATVLPPSFRKLQAGRALIQLIDSDVGGASSSSAVASGPSSTSSSFPSSSTRLNRDPSEESTADSSYDGDDFESEEVDGGAGANAAAESTEGDFGEESWREEEEEGDEQMSMASEQLHKVIQAAARAKPILAASSASSRPSSLSTAAAAAASSTSKLKSSSSSSSSTTPVASIRSAIVRATPLHSHSAATPPASSRTTAARSTSSSSSSTAAAAGAAPAARPLSSARRPLPASAATATSSSSSSSSASSLPRPASSAGRKDPPAAADSSSLSTAFVRPPAPRSKDLF